MLWLTSTPVRLDVWTCVRFNKQISLNKYVWWSDIVFQYSCHVQQDYKHNMIFVSNTSFYDWIPTMGGSMWYLLYHIPIGCGYNFLARCMSSFSALACPNASFVTSSARSSMTSEIHCLDLIFVQDLLHHRGDIRGDGGMFFHLVHDGIGCNIFDVVIANMQCRMRCHIHNVDNIQYGGPNVIRQSDTSNNFYYSRQVIELKINSKNPRRST